MSLLSWRSPKTEVRASAIHGRGLFARAAIARGEIVAVKGGHVFDGATLRRVEPIVGPAEIQVANDLFIGPLTADEREGSMLYTNHSCEPNLGIAGSIVFIARRSIASDEELTHDWAMTDDADHRMDCRCGTASCRGVITGRDWQLPELQARYGELMSWYLRERWRSDA